MECAKRHVKRDCKQHCINTCKSMAARSTCSCCSPSWSTVAVATDFSDCWRRSSLGNAHGKATLQNVQALYGRVFYHSLAQHCFKRAEPAKQAGNLPKSAKQIATAVVLHSSTAAGEQPGTSSGAEATRILMVCKLAPAAKFADILTYS